MRRMKFLLVILGVILTTGGAMADLCNDCLQYMSCNATVYYNGTASDESTAKKACDFAMDYFVQTLDSQEVGLSNYLSKIGYNVGMSIKFDLEQGILKEDTIMFAGGSNMFKYCRERGLCNRGTDTQYFDLLMALDKNTKLINFDGIMRTCPDGGHSNWENSFAGLTIGSCYISTFSDNTGRGEYQGNCYHDTDLDLE